MWVLSCIARLPREKALSDTTQLWHVELCVAVLPTRLLFVRSKMEGTLPRSSSDTDPQAGTRQALRLYRHYTLHQLRPEQEAVSEAK